MHCKFNRSKYHIQISQKSKQWFNENLRDDYSHGATQCLETLSNLKIELVDGFRLIEPKSLLLLCVD